MTRRICLLLILFLLPAAAMADYYAPGEHFCDAPDCFWELNMDVTDTESVWAMLTAPMTVLDGDHRAQKYVYAEPDEGSERIGEVTCTTQGVHVLESYDDGWSLIETYSSSFSSSRVKAWNQLVTGYVKTELLKTVDVDQEWGLVVDKFTQRLYVFHQGEMIEELLVSTGYGTSSEPYNETRSGEYLLYSATGGFVLTGDALFQGSIGRTDLPGGSHPQLVAAIRKKLLTLPVATTVYPGHGPATTIGAEARYNPYL